MMAVKSVAKTAQYFWFAIVCVVAGLVLNPALAREQPTAVWQDDFQSRLEVYALMQTFSVDILGSHSATKSLEKWCREHLLAAIPTIVARRIQGEERPLLPEQMQRLEVTNPEQVKYRKVQLFCGEQLLSEADNWYVPGRLTAAMNELLETTDTPFGKVIASLEPSRQTLSVKLLWSPLPEGWELTPRPIKHHGKSKALEIPNALFEHQTLLYSQDRKPISEVHEVYQRQILVLLPRH